MGIKLEIKNILKLPQILKIPQCGLSFICLMLYRVDLHVPGYYSLSIDARYLAQLACIGFFFISLVQIVSILLGDKTPTSDILFAICGFFFFIGSGSKGAADVYTGLAARYKATDAMLIITSFVYLVDLVFGIINLKNQ